MEKLSESRADYAGAGSSSSAHQSAVSWPAIFAGAAVAASVSLILFALGTGLGFASLSPWPRHGISGTTFAITTAIWLIAMQWISSGVGGYITGRLRTRWIGTHVHEVFFRDTAHGFVTWSVATVLVVAVLATSAFSAIGAGARATSGVASGVAQSMGPAVSQTANAYGVDKLFRVVGPSAGGSGADDPRVEAGHIIAKAVTSGSVPDADRSYLIDLVAARAGVTQADAQKRVDDFVASAMDAETKIKADADAARKAASQAAIYTALSMLIGAFIASVSAALGGRLRDEHL